MWPAGLGWDPAWLMLFALACVPAGPLGWLVVASVGGQVVWRATRPAWETARSLLGAVARAAWVLSWLAMAAFSLWPGLHGLIAFDLAIATFALAFGLHLDRLIRRRSHRSGNPRWVGGAAASVFAIEALAWSVVSLSGPQPEFGMAFAAAPVTLLTGLVAGGAGWQLVRNFWSEADRKVDDALRRTRLSGVPATWTPAGYLWEGTEKRGSWRVLAETARVPAGIRIEVAMPQTGRMLVRRRSPGEPSEVELADPILSTALVVGGVRPEVAELLLGNSHEAVLPLIHGRNAVLEHGVLRVDLAVREPLERPWEWIAPVLEEALEMARALDDDSLDKPGTDEVIETLRRISSAQETGAE